MNIPTSLHGAKELLRAKTSGSQCVELVHNATNEYEHWGPTGAQMDAVARSFSRNAREILDELLHNLKNRDKAWRPCYKTLLVLDHLARNVGESHLSEVCALVPLLREISVSFYYTNSKGVDHGVSVRERAKKLAELLSDGEMLQQERDKSRMVKAKLKDNGSSSTAHQNPRYGGFGSERTSPGTDRGTRRYPYDSYDPYVGTTGSRAKPSTPTPPRTPAEQERYDMEMALRLQREEESRSGMTARELENMYNAKAAAKRREEARSTAEQDLARRLEEEEAARRQTSGPTAPVSAPQGVTTSAPPAPAAPEPAPKPAPQANLLDDLFAGPAAPTPAAPTAAPPTAPQAPADPFSNFFAAPTAPGGLPTSTAGPGGYPAQAAAPQQMGPGGQWGAPQGAYGQPQQAPQWGAPQGFQQGGAQPGYPQAQWGGAAQAAPPTAWGQPGQYPMQQQQQQQPQPQQPGQWVATAPPADDFFGHGSGPQSGQPVNTQQDMFSNFMAAPTQGSNNFPGGGGAYH